MCVVAEHAIVPLSGLRVGIFSPPIQIQDILHWVTHGLLNGRSAVLLFFVLSGYVLMLQWDGQPGLGVHKYLAFVVRRLFRIMPAFWLSIFFSYLLIRAFQMDVAPTPAALFNNLTLQDTHINLVTWSVVAEVVCSLLFPLLLYAHRRASLVGRAALFLALFALLLFNQDRPYIGYLVFFYVGLLVHDHGPRLAQLRAKGVWFVGAFLMYGFMPQLWIFGPRVPGPYFLELSYLAAQVIPTFIIVSLVVYGRVAPIDKALGLATLRFIGKISFSLYLFHYTLGQAFWKVFVYKVTNLWPYYFGLEIVFFLAIAALSIIVATVVYVLVERPLTRFGRRVAAQSI